MRGFRLRQTPSVTRRNRLPAIRGLERFPATTLRRVDRATKPVSARNRRLGYPVVIVASEWRRGRRIVRFVTTSNRALWWMDEGEFRARFAEEG